MDKLVDMLSSDPLKAVSILAAALIVWFIKREHKHRDEQFSGFKEQITDWKHDIRSLSNDLSFEINQQKTYLNETIIGLKSNLLQFNKSLNIKIEELQNYIEKIEKDGPQTLQQMKNVTSAFNERLGKIIEISGKLEATYGKVIHLNGEVEAMKKNVLKHSEQIGKIAKYLESQKEKK